MLKVASVGILGTLVLFGGCRETVLGDGPGCSEQDVSQIEFNPPLEGAGRYEFTLNVDGERGTCSCQITASGSEEVGCSQSDWDINQTLKGAPGKGGAGSAIEPIPPTDITAIVIRRPKVPHTVKITVKRDDKVIIEGEFPFESKNVDNSCGTTTKERNAEISTEDLG